jgi:hypothetical protein
VADAVILPSIAQQIRTVAALRWRILRNSLRKKNNVLDLIGVITSGFFGALMALGIAFAIFWGTYTFMAHHHEERMALLFWAIFLWWQIFPIMAAGFGAHFDFRTLLRFPLNLSTFFIISIAYGLADLTALAALLWLAAMIIAVAVANLSALPVMIFVCAVFIAANVTLERLIGSWLEKVLAKRRWRELFFALFILTIVGVQFIGPMMQKYGKVATPRIQQILPYFSPFPGSLAGHAVAGAALHDGSAVLISALGLAGWALAFGVLLWFRLAAQYRGEELSETSAAAPIVKRTAVKAVAERESPGILSPQLAAMLKKESKYVFRNSFALAGLIFSPLLVLLLVTQFAAAHSTTLHHGMSPDMFFPGMMGYLILILMAPSYNCFAYEGRGMIGYFMSPLRFREVLLGKNLMLCMIMFLEVGLCAGVLVWRIGMPALPVFVSTLVGVVFAVVGQLTLANWSSLTFPKKMAFGKMRGQRQSGMAVLIAFAAQIIFGAICGVVLFSGRWTNNPWLPTEAFAFLAAGAVAGYFASLDGLSRLAESKKESLLDAIAK